MFLPCQLLVDGFSCLLSRPRKRFTDGDIFRIWNCDGKMAYEDIIEATGDFHMGYCVGTGGYGRVVALKKLHTLEGQNPAFDKCFRKEAQILSGIRHRNIVKLFGICLHKRCMLLIYDYMERGSMFCLLRDDDEVVELDWNKRVNVVKGISHAVSYLNHDCSPPIMHRKSWLHLPQKWPTTSKT